MTVGDAHARDDRRDADGAPRIVLASLIVFLYLFPPETRGAAGAAICGAIALLATLAMVRDRARAAAWGLVALGVAAWPLSLAADAPGPALPALAAPAVGLAFAAAGGAFGGGGSGRGPVALGLAIGGSLAAAHSLFQATIGLDALGERLSAHPELLPHAEDVLGRLASGRAFAAFATPAALGGALALSLPATAGLAVVARGGRRALAGLALTIQGLGLLATRSATAAIALACAAALAAAVSRDSTRRWLIPLGVAAALALTSAVVLRGDEIIDTGGASNPLRLRAANWRSAAAMTADHPWTGVGVGGFGEAYPLYRAAGANESRHAHNLPLEAVAELGAPLGLAIAALFLVVFLGPVARRGKFGDPQLVGISVGLAAFAVHNLADFTAFLPSLLWAACAARGSLNSRSGQTPAPVWLGPAAVTVVLGACAVAAGAALSWDARWRAIERGAAGAHGEAVTAARAAVEWAPFDPDARLQWARALLATERPRPSARTLALATSAVDDAVDLSPGRPGPRRLRARLREAAGDVGGALADLELACRARPIDPECVRERERVAARIGSADFAGTDR